LYIVKIICLEKLKCHIIWNREMMYLFGTLDTRAWIGALRYKKNLQPFNLFGWPNLPFWRPLVLAAAEPILAAFRCVGMR
jgi:hypothetical protein